MRIQREKIYGTVSVLVFASLVSLMSASAFAQRERGSEAQYDPGPKKDSLWIPMFGSVPNYRKIGVDYTGREKFRWNIGPMWYRGRLGENQVKVLVVGQEGAQDENTSNRTFTGGTGTKTQNMLKALEMDRSYLFLNTFVYTIFGQRDEEDAGYMEMEQGADSPIVKYRHQLMDYTAQYNSESLAMMVAVGSGAKASLITWIESRGGRCPDRNANRCDTSDMKIYAQEFGDQTRANEADLESIVPGVRYTNREVRLKNKTLVIHVPHPGMARFPGGATIVNRGFKTAADRIQAFIDDNRTWLDGRRGRAEPDTGSRQDIIDNMNNFSYRNTQVPHRDFAFGTTWRLGDGGTNTVRHGQDAIVIRATGTEYASRGRHDFSRLGRERRDGSAENYGRPWEPQRWDPEKPENAMAFDYGPCGYVEPGEDCELSRLMMSWPDFFDGDNAPKQSESFGIGRIYRGNPSNAKLIILADQFSYDDFFTARALTGAMGQRLQTWLGEKGYSNADSDDSNDYVIVRTMPIDTLSMDEDERLALARSAGMDDARNAILREIMDMSRGGGRRFIEFATFGNMAKSIAEDSIDFLSGEHISVRDLSDDLTDIPRVDLPYSTRYFMGTSGNRATTDDGQYYRFQAPMWVKRTPIPEE